MLDHRFLIFLIFAYSGVPNSMYPLSSPSSFQSLYAQHWFVYSLINEYIFKSFFFFLKCRRPPMFPFVFPPGYPFSPAVLSQGSSSTHTASGHSSSITNHGNNSLSQKRSTTHRYVY